RFSRDWSSDVCSSDLLGLPRTGSTLLHRLLAASPRLTSTLSWETSYPIPFPGEGPGAEERKRRAEKQAQLFLELSPDFADLHTRSEEHTSELQSRENL